MKLLKVTDTQYVPTDKIDFISVDNEDRCKLVIHTIGNMMINNTYQSEEQCLQEFNRVINLLDKLEPWQKYGKIFPDMKDIMK